MAPERRGPAAALLLLLLGCGCTAPPAPTVVVDVCVYGATSAGVSAAVQAARDGRTVALLDCDGWVGGLTSSGLGATDVGCDPAIGGLAREFYRRIRRHYDDDAAWTGEARSAFRGRGHAAGSDVAFTFEPHVASAVFGAMLAEAGVVPIAARLDRGAGGVVAAGARLGALRTEDGRWIRARVFLDCSYEGDLLAAAGCSFVVGREANAEFGETLNGVATALATKHQFAVRVDPWQRPGDPGSGLLPGIEAADDLPDGGVPLPDGRVPLPDGRVPLPDGRVPLPDGSADHRVQAYCYRLCASRDPANRVPWPRPADYDECDYELLLRWYDAGAAMAPWHPVAMPNRKTDSNNNGAVSTDAIGASWRWPEADYAERARIAAAHRRWQQGLLWTLANHPRVPFAVRREFQAYGLAGDEFAATDHWPPLLYVREGRRLRGEAVVTERDCVGARRAVDPVGLGAYAMDSHNVRRHVVDGAVRNEGDVQVRVPAPYGIPYRALVPQRRECDNLLVPVAVSATHIAYGSIRMEPVFLVLGQSAAVAASIAIERDLPVQDVPYDELARRLRDLGQVLALGIDLGGR